MALKNRSLFLYGYQVTELNRSLDFKNAIGGPELRATLTIGYYSLSSLMLEIKRAIRVVDQTNVYTITADRTLAGGTENRVTIATSGTFLSLLFQSGTRAASTCAPLLGFSVTDKTGATSYTSQTSSGTSFVTHMQGYDYTSPEFMQKLFGSKNTSASGETEAIVFQAMKYMKFRFKYIPEADATMKWAPFLLWACKQRLIEFTPDITLPSQIYEARLESTQEDAKGLGFSLNEMIDERLPGLYDTGALKFRVFS